MSGEVCLWLERKKGKQNCTVLYTLRGGEREREGFGEKKTQSTFDLAESAVNL